MFLGGALASASTKTRGGKTLKLVTEVVPFGRRTMTSPIIIIMVVVVVLGWIMLLMRCTTTIAPHKMASMGPF